MGTPPRRGTLFEWRGTIDPVTLARHARTARQQLVRSLIGGPILAWIAGGPVFEWIARSSPNVSPRLRWILAAYVLLWPALMALQAYQMRRALRRQPTRGTGYRITERSLLNGEEAVLTWSSALAYRPVLIDGTERLQLVHRRGLHKTLHLPSDPAEAAAVYAEIARRVPLHDPAAHGSVDDVESLPRWIGVSAVATMLGAMAFTHAIAGPVWRWRIAHGHHDDPLLVLAMFALPLLVWPTWYLMVRRGFNLIQRARLKAFALGGGMAFWLAAILILGTPELRLSLDYLQTVPPEVRDRAARTILPHDRRP